MPKITSVKKAQQRYQMVPVLDDDGNPKRVPVMGRDGQQKKTKFGKPVTKAITVADKSQPLPDLKCDFPGCDINGGLIAVGTPYKHMTPHGSAQKSRHAEHPNWNPWEYSSALWARVAQVQSEMENTIEGLSEVDDFESVRDDLAQQAQELLDEKQESLDAMPEGLASGSELEEQVSALESWVDEIGSADAPEVPEPEPVTKWFVHGPDEQSLNEEGYEEEGDASRDRDKYLAEHPEEDPDDWEITSEEQEAEDSDLDEEALDEWLEEAKQALREAVEGCEI